MGGYANFSFDGGHSTNWKRGAIKMLKQLNIRIGYLLITALMVIMLSSALPETAQAIFLDLSDPSSSGTINEALFNRVAAKGTGTGSFDPFVRIQGSGKEGDKKGYNTSGSPQFDTKGGIWTHSIELGEIPIVNIDGVNYHELILDAAEPGENKNTLFIDVFELYLLDAGGYDSYPADFPSATLKYSFFDDNPIKLDNIHGGNGISDMYAYIPVSKFGGTTNTYLYLYSELSEAGGSFEEWGVKTVIPEPATLSLLSLGFLGFGFARRKKRGTS